MLKKDLNEFERLYEAQFIVLAKAKDLIENEADEKDYFKILTDEFQSLLKQTVKLVKRSDNIQKKLRETQLKLEEKNQIITNDLNKASDYVQSLLPEKLENEILSIDWSFKPTSELGGDIFGYHFLDNDNLAIYLIDVSGHGVQAALHSVSVLNTIKYQNLTDVDFKKPDEVLNGLNKAFQMSEHGEKFFTMWYSVLNIKTLEMVYITAGHPPGLEINSEIIEYENQNFFIGGLPEFPFNYSKVKLNSNSQLYIYSDGVYEVQIEGNQIWDIPNLKKYLFDKKNSENILEELYRYLIDMNGNKQLDDDYSIVKIQIK